MPPANMNRGVDSSGRFYEKTREMHKTDIAIDSIVIGLSVALLWISLISGVTASI